MRLIDADALLKAFYRELDNAILYGRIVKPLQDLINEAPTVDAVPVVRCKDCKYCNTDWAMGKWYGSCKVWNTHSVMADWYCINGEMYERKNSNEAYEFI